ncbi:MAG: hypothetical protein CK426_04680 [Legionella sp.]|nr:MAG: hypothetical protein CK423_08800 [Legionella sp.]PJD98874.1 MAG: hypothetical protein CK426_04680 [Legionella sp.]
MKELYASGWSKFAIAKQLGIGKTTMRRILDEKID